MPRYVAFLRAINVGGHVVKMSELKTRSSAAPSATRRFEKSLGLRATWRNVRTVSRLAARLGPAGSVR